MMTFHALGAIPLHPRALASGGEGLGVGGAFLPSRLLLGAFPPPPTPPRHDAAHRGGRGEEALRPETYYV